jgi:hypothetical protein
MGEEEPGTMSEHVLKLGIPAGSLQEATAQLFRRAGYHIALLVAVLLPVDR